MNATGNNDRENVLAATDLVRLIGEHVQLRPKGREFAGLCPFHDDKNPSMQVSPQKQIYKCFSCGAGGTCYDFVMGYHKLSFPEAMKMLADRAGIELTPFKPGKGGSAPNPQTSDRRKRLLSANELALAFFQRQLATPEAQPVRDYIAKRGISDEMVEHFQIGYAPHSWHALSEAVAQKQWDKPAFENAGLVADGQRGLYDKLRHRLVFPICDDMGRAIAFGGRTLPGNELDDPTVDAKYLNSPETALFNKSRTLYGLHLAKKAIIDSKTAVIVEGYTDVVACHQHGRCNVVAALGTAFTPEHATKLRRFCEKVVLVFDGDAAGHKAADRAVEVLFAGEVDVAVALLAPGQDPDELLSTPDGEAAWDAMIEQASDAMQYLLTTFEGALGSAETIAGKSDLTTAFLTRLSRYDIGEMPVIRRSFIIERLSHLLHMNEQAVLDELKRLKPRRYTNEPPPVLDESDPTLHDYEIDAISQESVQPEHDSSSKLPSMALVERQLVACLLRDNDLFHGSLPDGADFCEAVPPGDVLGEGRRVYQLLHDRFADGDTLSLRSLLAELAEMGWDRERRWLTMADVELDLHLDGDERRLKQLFTEAALAIDRQRRRQAFEQDSRSVMQAGQSAQDPVAAALAMAGQVQRLAQQRRGEDDPGRIARVGEN